MVLILRSDWARLNGADCGRGGVGIRRYRHATRTRCRAATPPSRDPPQRRAAPRRAEQGACCGGSGDHSRADGGCYRWWHPGTCPRAPPGPSHHLRPARAAPVPAPPPPPPACSGHLSDPSPDSQLSCRLSNFPVPISQTERSARLVPLCVPLCPLYPCSARSAGRPPILSARHALGGLCSTTDALSVRPRVGVQLDECDSELMAELMAEFERPDELCSEKWAESWSFTTLGKFRDVETRAFDPSVIQDDSSLRGYLSVKNRSSFGMCRNQTGPLDYPKYIRARFKIKSAC